MEIYAQGKNIPTYSFSRLFVQGENCADTLTFVVDSVYGGNNLSDCDFCIVGVSDDRWEVMQTLIPEICGDKIKLAWKVSKIFTQNSGTLALELRASRNDELVLKYEMEPVYVRKTLHGENAPLPDTSEQIISDIIQTASDSVAVIDEEKNNALDELQSKMDAFNLDETNERLDRIEDDTAVYLARPEVVALTQAQYDAISPKKDSLYVIVEEV
ncbi:MAG: hypothetical protein IJN14_00585 [Ruminococcus sp.]|nr:hypothetical protein [Ruminococcus sp.]